MRAYVFFSVHERLLHPVAVELRSRYRVDSFAGFVWGKDQRAYLEAQEIDYRPLHVFTRDLLPRIAQAPPDLGYLESRERRYGISLHRMIFAERHLLAGRSYDELLKLVEETLRLLETSWTREPPDFCFSENVACLTSYLHWAVARGLDIPYWCVGDARFSRHVTVYRDLQEWGHTRERFERLLERGLEPEEREAAAGYLRRFRERPRRPAGMGVRSRLPVASRDDLRRIRAFASRHRQDPESPVLDSAATALWRRLRRLVRARLSRRMFERPRPGERYVLFPIHFQPEASTLVLAPYYLDQLALIENIAKSLPVGHRLYVKEHPTNRGRRPPGFYRRIRAVPAMRLLGPREDTWTLIRDASAVAVITGTVGWEGLLFGKPVITFGNVFFNATGLVYRAGRLPPDDWYQLFRRAIFEHRHDEERLLAFIAAMQQTSRPGFMRNPLTFPEAADPGNVRDVADAVAAAAGLTETGPRSDADPGRTASVTR